MASRNINKTFHELSPQEKVDCLLSNTNFDLNAANADRFFNLTFHELDGKVQKQFTPEIMARYGRDAMGQLTQESLERGVQDYGMSALGRTL